MAPESETKIARPAGDGACLCERLVPVSVPTEPPGAPATVDLVAALQAMEAQVAELQQECARLVDIGNQREAELLQRCARLTGMCEQREAERSRAMRTLAEAIAEHTAAAGQWASEKRTLQASLEVFRQAEHCRADELDDLRRSAERAAAEALRAWDVVRIGAEKRAAAELEAARWRDWGRVWCAAFWVLNLAWGLWPLLRWLRH